jgi:hypothetical protein
MNKKNLHTPFFQSSRVRIHLTMEVEEPALLNINHTAALLVNDNGRLMEITESKGEFLLEDEAGRTHLCT